jgi:hypothetical protein
VGQGPGKYDVECSIVLEDLKATAVLLLVVGGTKGNGLSISTYDKHLLTKLPTVLRDLADQIENNKEPQDATINHGADKETR